MIVVILRTETQSNCECGFWQEQEWLPRTCPRCGQATVIGHGRRWKPAHDLNHTRIRVRRGLCNQCDLTMTVLPAWSLPHSRYTLYARAQAVDSYVQQGLSLEQASPRTSDPDRVADPATLRRWFQRRLLSLWACTAAVRTLGKAAVLLPPTIFAWDWLAGMRILIPETESP